jgi:hypothetical protein
MNRTTHTRPTPALGFAAQGIGSWFGGIMKSFLHQASAEADVAATQ